MLMKTQQAKILSLATLLTTKINKDPIACNRYDIVAAISCVLNTKV